ncbi:mannitol dehydrogenase family protein [Plantibacter sp. Mn2098]|uniref:mannitol dehydrogenase family protein n=1 Tax=Plantibacter sp. Mn2098 TaxID=3395266 RepID=UPI003BC671FB
MPSYDRSALTAGIVQIGVGNFHRAHQAMYIDRLLNLGLGADWALWGVSVNAKPARMLNELRAQDHLYTLTEKAPDGSRSTRVIGSILGFDSAVERPEAVLARLADPSTRIIALTITEGGYGIDPATGRFSGAQDPLICEDLASAASTASWLGLIVNALRRRRETGAGPVTIMSCDNIEENGSVTREALTGFAARVAPDMLEWIDENTSFPSSMVDRVTPGTTPEDHAYLRNAYEIEDEWAVTCEPFTQWVVEDRFVNGRPDFAAAGVGVVDDVAPFERMKLRLANGTHQSLCFIGALLGFDYVHEAIADPDIRSLLLRYIDEEAVPTLDAIDGVDFTRWGRTVLERFGNPQLRDPISRICAETSDRIPKFLLPVVRDRLARGLPVETCAAVIASWARYATGIDESGAPIVVVDPRRERVMAAASRATRHPIDFLRLTEIFGSLADEPAFVAPFERALWMFHHYGARVSLRALNAQSVDVNG